jgi:hypothetical protein
MHWAEDMGGIVIALAMLVTMTFCTLNCSDEFRCSNDYDCPSTKVCNKASGACHTLECETDNDCLNSGNICQNNSCTQAQDS